MSQHGDLSVMKLKLSCIRRPLYIQQQRSLYYIIRRQSNYAVYACLYTLYTFYITTFFNLFVKHSTDCEDVRTIDLFVNLFFFISVST